MKKIFLYPYIEAFLGVARNAPTRLIDQFACFYGYGSNVGALRATPYSTWIFTVFLISILSFTLSFAAECPVQPSTQGPVHYYGKLKVREGKSLIDGTKTGAVAVQIRGVSFFWSHWSGQFYNAAAVERMAKDWKAEVVRAAYGATGSTSPADRQSIKTVVEAAIDNDIYVIIDWHSHTAHNAAETDRAIDFFKEMAQLYGSCDNVIFELYNEPTDGNGGTWANIKSYAEKVIPEIRNHSGNLILVGTPSYSQKVQDITAINDENVGYVLHFYAASHPISGWQDNINAALRAGLPIFVTEYGTTTADGGCSPEVSDCEIRQGIPVDNYNSHNAVNSDAWHAYMDKNKISSAAWSVFDKYEGSAFFGTVPKGTFDQSPENWSDTTKMTAAGRYIFKKLNNYYLTAPWNPATPILPHASQPILPGTAVEVYSLQGKKVGENISNLKNGVYILLLRQNGTVQTKILRIAK